MNVFENTYSIKSSAVRGAKRASLPEGSFIIEQDDEGAWRIRPAVQNEDAALLDVLTNGAKIEAEDPIMRDGEREENPEFFEETQQPQKGASVETTTEALSAPLVSVEGVEEKKPLSVEDMTAQAKEKSPTYKELAHYNKSMILQPLKFIHNFLDQNPHLSRKDAVTHLVQAGINFATARRQYQRWYTKRKG